MKFMQQLSGAAAAAVILFSSGCSQPTAPAIQEDILTYSVDGSDQTLLADITYLDTENRMVKLSDQSLPWSVSMIMSTDFTGDAYLKAEIPQDEVFVPFLSGTADADLLKKLSDFSKDFSVAGVSPGDIVYSDPATLERSDVISVEDTHTLNLQTDLLPNGNETYYIYRKKTLSSSIILNDTGVKDVVSESERTLSALVQTSIER